MEVTMYWRCATAGSVGSRRNACGGAARATHRLHLGHHALNWARRWVAHVLLAVRASEDGVAEHIQPNKQRKQQSREVGVVVNEEPRLQRVSEGHPREVAESKHVPEAVRGNVHGGEDGLLRSGVWSGDEAAVGRGSGQS